MLSSRIRTFGLICVIWAVPKMANATWVASRPVPMNAQDYQCLVPKKTT